MKQLVVLILLITNLATFGQHNFRSSDNPYYWKNKKPYEGYWQQDVQYTIEAEIIDSLDIIDCKKYELIYWNNSPHELNELYFHLYQNAFQPNSHMHDLYKNNDYKVTFGKYEAQGLGTTINNPTVNGDSVETELDNTILKVKLNTPLKPNESLVVALQFKTYFDKGSLRRRMKSTDSFGFKHYDGVHWYPSIAVFDKKFAWTTEQHMDKEFYADFGSFDVKLTFPNNYIVDATGTLQNTEEVYPDSTRQQLDIKNFTSKVDTPSVVIERIADSTKTWHFYAENVHNFAFTADPLYRIGEIEWNGVKVVTLAREQNAHGWQKSGNFTKKVIKTYSEDFGMYAWPKIIVADADDGMEYPMLTLDNGTYPRHQGLLAHEVGHMWFYGMVGTNETYRAMMDEGFTQFLTIWSLDKITGESTERNPKSKYLKKHTNPYRNRYERLYYPYIKTALNDFDKALNTHSSDFNGATRHAGNYGLVYYKTGVMLYNLRYVLGEELFLDAMKHYFKQWSMAHPYPEDFRNSITEYTQVDLNWFFDQWMETIKTIDYGITSVNTGDSTASITFERFGEMQMPIDFIVITKDDDTLHYHIPNTWFKKDTEATILPKWYGWGNIHKTYTANLALQTGIKNIIIDPEHYLADVNLSNNQWKGFNHLQFDHKVKNLPEWEKSNHYIRPDIWFNQFDGVQAGVHLEGNYFENQNKYALTLWGNTKVGQYDIDPALEDKYSKLAYDFSASQKLSKIWKHLSFKLYSSYNAGLSKTGISLNKKFQKRDLWNPNYTRLSWNLDFMHRASISQAPYLLYNNSWGFAQHNNTSNIRFTRYYAKHKFKGNTSLHVRTPGIYGDYNYSYLSLKNINNWKGAYLTLRTRLYGRAGFGNTPIESALFAAGASPEKLSYSKFTRAAGIVPPGLIDAGQFHIGGGLNLRGFNYLDITTASTTGSSFSSELEFQNIFKVKPKSRFLRNFKLKSYFFYDMGIMVYNDNQDVSDLMADAGIGTSLKIYFGKLNIQPLEIRVDLPLFISDDIANNQDVMDKILIGINTSF